MFLKVIETCSKKYEEVLLKHKDKSVSYNKISAKVFNRKIIKLLSSLLELDGKPGKSYIATLPLDKNISAVVVLKVETDGSAHFYSNIGLKEDMETLIKAMKG